LGEKRIPASEDYSSDEEPLRRRRISKAAIRDEQSEEFKISEDDLSDGYANAGFPPQSAMHKKAPPMPMKAPQARQSAPIAQ
jgi:hypothetical protein